MSGGRAKCVAAVAVLVGCGLLARADDDTPGGGAQPPGPTVTYTKQPAVVGNPPIAGRVDLEVDWANCIGAREVKTYIHEVKNGKVVNPHLSVIGMAFTIDMPNQTWGQQWTGQQSGKTVVFITEVLDKNKALIKSGQSNTVTVP